VAFDRLLKRLARAEPDAWILKGGLALQLRLGEKARLTKDIDLLLRKPLADAPTLLRRAASAELGDRFAFEVAEAASALEPTQGGVRRFPIHPLLDGRTFEDFHVDVGVGDPVVGAADMLVMPPLLAFAGLEATNFPAYPLTQHIAEKVHAYTQPHPYGERTRVRDLVDLLLIAGHAPLDAIMVRLAIEATFSSRQTHPIPSVLPEPPKSWRIPYRQMADEVRLAWIDLTAGYMAAARFLNPVLRTQVSGTWDPSTRTWGGDARRVRALPARGRAARDGPPPSHVDRCDWTRLALERRGNLTPHMGEPEIRTAAIPGLARPGARKDPFPPTGVSPSP
jgi:hypothetical protein